MCPITTRHSLVFLQPPGIKTHLSLAPLSPEEPASSNHPSRSAGSQAAPKKSEEIHLERVNLVDFQVLKETAVPLQKTLLTETKGAEFENTTTGSGSGANLVGKWRQQWPTFPERSKMRYIVAKSSSSMTSDASHLSLVLHQHQHFEGK